MKTCENDVAKLSIAWQSRCSGRIWSSIAAGLRSHVKLINQMTDKLSKGSTDTEKLIQVASRGATPACPLSLRTIIEIP